MESNSHSSKSPAMPDGNPFNKQLIEETTSQQETSQKK
jgi:hypothetical protein